MTCIRSKMEFMWTILLHVWEWQSRAFIDALKGYRPKEKKYE